MYTYTYRNVILQVDTAVASECHLQNCSDKTTFTDVMSTLYTAGINMHRFTTSGYNATEDNLPSDRSISGDLPGDKNMKHRVPVYCFYKLFAWIFLWRIKSWVTRYAAASVAGLSRSGVISPSCAKTCKETVALRLCNHRNWTSKAPYQLILKFTHATQLLPYTWSFECILGY